MYPDYLIRILPTISPYSILYIHLKLLKVRIRSLTGLSMRKNMAKFQSRLATHDWNHILSSKDTQGAITSFHDTICKLIMDAFPLVEAIQSISPESLGKVIH